MIFVAGSSNEETSARRGPSCYKCSEKTSPPRTGWELELGDTKTLHIVLGVYVEGRGAGRKKYTTDRPLANREGPVRGLSSFTLPQTLDRLDVLDHLSLASLRTPEAAKTLFFVVLPKDRGARRSSS